MIIEINRLTGVGAPEWAPREEKYNPVNVTVSRLYRHSAFNPGVSHLTRSILVCHLFSMSINLELLTDIFMETRLNLRNKYFLASTYHDLWDMPHIDNFKKQDLHLGLPVASLLKWRRLQLPMTLDCLTNKT
ncbi:hypothetical protein ALC56_03431 [Trachymyrmex septentrionalis]|uniref:Uncharacterized protein n=1 Tax=Trachymyrmex septentrionalis TaxID=34720 RepID=A0A195FPA8_9HYME|nr:hypothetical protein ALC56_03431 [Trachymyrmex septentrionalis]